MVIESLNKGAIDFIKKPINPDTLLAKIKAYLRHYHEVEAAINNRKMQTNIIFNKWILEREKFQIFDQNNMSGNLTPQEYNLLDCLISNAGCAVHRDKLCQILSDDNRIPTARNIDVKITRLRKKIHDNSTNPQIIKTIRGIGYLFNQEEILCEK